MTDTPQSQQQPQEGNVSLSFTVWEAADKTRTPNAPPPDPPPPRPRPPLPAWQNAGKLVMEYESTTDLVTVAAARAKARGFINEVLNTPGIDEIVVAIHIKHGEGEEAALMACNQYSQDALAWLGNR